MIFDTQQVVTIGNLLISPNFTTDAVPTPPANIKEIVLLGGTSTGTTTISIGGTADQTERSF